MGNGTELKQPFMQDHDERDFITHFIIPFFFFYILFFFFSFLLIVMFTFFSLFLCWTIYISIANILNPMEEKKRKNNMHRQRVLSHVLIINICNKMVVPIAPPNGNWEYDFSQNWKYCTILYTCTPLIKN